MYASINSSTASRGRGLYVFINIDHLVIWYNSFYIITHCFAKKTAIVESIRENSLLEPIICCFEETGDHQIKSEHRRLAA